MSAEIPTVRTFEGADGRYLHAVDVHEYLAKCIEVAESGTSRFGAVHAIGMRSALTLLFELTFTEGERRQRP